MGRGATFLELRFDTSKLTDDIAKGMMAAQGVADKNAIKMPFTADKEGLRKLLADIQKSVGKEGMASLGFEFHLVNEEEIQHLKKNLQDVLNDKSLSGKGLQDAVENAFKSAISNSTLSMKDWLEEVGISADHLGATLRQKIGDIKPIDLDKADMNEMINFFREILQYQRLINESSAFKSQANPNRLSQSGQNLMNKLNEAMTQSLANGHDNITRDYATRITNSIVDGYNQALHEIQNLKFDFGISTDGIEEELEDAVDEASEKASKSGKKVKVGATPEIDPEEFVAEIENKLKEAGVKVKVSVEPDLEKPEEFTNEITDKLRESGSKVEVDVRPKEIDAAEFNDETKNKLNTGIITGKNINNAIVTTNNATIKSQEEIQKEVDKTAESYGDLLYVLGKYADSIESVNSFEKLGQGIPNFNKKVTQKDAKKALDNYLESTSVFDGQPGVADEEDINILIRYVHQLNDAEKATKFFGDENQIVYDEIVKRLERVLEWQELYKTSLADLKKRESESVKALKSTYLGDVSKNDIIDFLRSNDISDYLYFKTPDDDYYTAELYFDLLEEKLGVNIPRSAEEAKQAVLDFYQAQSQALSQEQQQERGQNDHDSKIGVNVKPEFDAAKFVQQVQNDIDALPEETSQVKIDTAPLVEDASQFVKQVQDSINALPDDASKVEIGIKPASDATDFINDIKNLINPQSGDGETATNQISVHIAPDVDSQQFYQDIKTILSSGSADSEAGTNSIPVFIHPDPTSINTFVDAVQQAINSSEDSDGVEIKVYPNNDLTGFWVKLQSLVDGEKFEPIEVPVAPKVDSEELFSDVKEQLSGGENGKAKSIPIEVAPKLPNTWNSTEFVKGLADRLTGLEQITDKIKQQIEKTFKNLEFSININPNIDLDTYQVSKYKDKTAKDLVDSFRIKDKNARTEIRALVSDLVKAEVNGNQDQTKIVIEQLKSVLKENGSRINQQASAESRASFDQTFKEQLQELLRLKIYIPEENPDGISQKDIMPDILKLLKSRGIITNDPSATLVRYDTIVEQLSEIVGYEQYRMENNGEQLSGKEAIEIIGRDLAALLEARKQAEKPIEYTSEQFTQAIDNAIQNAISTTQQDISNDPDTFAKDSLMNLDELITKFGQLKDVLDEVGKAYQAAFSLDGNQATIDFDALSKIDSDFMQEFYMNANLLSDGLNIIFEAFNRNFNITPEMLNYINQIVSQGEALKRLVSILKIPEQNLINVGDLIGADSSDIDYLNHMTKEAQALSQATDELDANIDALGEDGLAKIFNPEDIYQADAAIQEVSEGMKSTASASDLLAESLREYFSDTSDIKASEEAYEKLAGKIGDTATAAIKAHKEMHDTYVSGSFNYDEVTGELRSADLTFRNEALKTNVTEQYRLVKAEEDEEAQLKLVNSRLVENVEARNKAVEAENKKAEAAQKTTAKTLEQIQSNIDLGTYDTQFTKVEQGIKKLKNASDETKKELETLKTVYEALKNPKNSDKRIENEKAFQDQLKKTSNLLNQDKSIQSAKDTINSAIDSASKRLDKFKKQFDGFTGYKKFSEDIDTSFKNFKIQLENGEISLESFKQKINELIEDNSGDPGVKALGGKFLDSTAQNWDEAKAAINRFLPSLGKVKKELSFSDTPVDELYKATAQIQEAGGAVKNVSFLFRDGQKNIAYSVKHMKTELVGLAAVFDTLKNEWEKLSARWSAQLLTPQNFIQYIRQGVKVVQEYDDALVEMRKVSDESLDSLKNFQRESFNLSNAVGTTALQIQKSTADWLRLGKSFEEAKRAAQETTVLMNVSEFKSIDDATTAMIAMKQAYDELDFRQIIDELNIVGNSFSISTNDLAQGLQNAASVLKTQGNSIEESIALITAGNSVLQDVSKTAAGIRTISLRLSSSEISKKELEDMGEDVSDYVVQTSAKLQQTIKELTRTDSNKEGVNIVDPNGSLKNTYEILKEISQVYKEIQEEDKKYGSNRAAALVEYLAGSLPVLVEKLTIRLCICA